MKLTYRPAALRLVLFFAIVLLLSFCLQGVAGADGPITLHYEFAAPKIAARGGYYSVTMEGLVNLDQAGMPRLPIKASRVIVPFGQRVGGVEVTCDAEVALEGSYVVEPGQEQRPLGRGGPVTPTLPSPEIYNASEPFPGVLYSAPSSHMRKGYQMLILTLYPVQYAPQEGGLSYCSSMTVRVHTEPAAAGAEEMLRRRPRQWAADRAEVKAIVDNPEAAESYPSSAHLAARTQGAAPLLNPATPYDYAIITNQALMSAPGPNNFQALAAAKEARGISTVITTTEWISATYSGLRPDGGQDLQTKIRNFVIDAYQTWGTDYVLLGGDGDGGDVGGESGDTIIPHRGFYVEAGSDTDYDIPADMYYACLDGTFDYDADGIYGEPTDGPGGGEVDLYAEVYVGRAAVDSADELANFVAKTLAYESGGGNYLRDAWMVGEDLGWPAPWGGDRKDDVLYGSSAAGYTTVGFEDSAYAPFFDTQTLYDRDYPGNNWPKSEIIGVINSPAHIINHDGHASVTYVMKMDNSDVDNSLTNDHYFIGYSQGCYDGAFDNRDAPPPYGSGGYLSSDCISEHLANGSHGAVAFVGNSRFGWGDGYDPHLGASQYYDRQFWDAVLGENIFNVGRANQDSKEDTYGVVGAGGFYSIMRWVYYELNVFGDPELVIKTGADTVSYQDHTIDDDNSGGSSGNDDGRVDVGETIEMPVTLFNARSTEVTTVTAMLSTADTYVTITDDLASYGDIAAGGSAASATPYVFSVGLSCPDDHWITFTLDITGTVDVTGTVGTWSDTFQVEVHDEPQIGVSPASYDETLDWGGTVTRTLTISNTGLAALEFEIGEEEGGFSPLAASCSETYGSWAGGTWSGGTRDRGDFFRADFPTTLSEIRFYLNLAASTDMYFVVYESDALAGSYAKIHETFIPSTGTGEGWYSSGPIAVDLYAGQYYYVGASWNGSATYGRGTEAVPMTAACLGTLETGAGNLAGYPPGDSFTNTSGGISPYYMHLEFGGGDVPWLSEDPITGTVAAGSAMPVTITFDASQVAQPGVHQADLRISSNDPYTPTVSVPVTLTVQPSPNMGKLRGTVTSDRPGGPLEGALVEVISGTTGVISGTTDASGDYGPWWLMNGSYTVRVSADGYLSDTQGVSISAGVTTTHDVTLVRNAPQIAVAPTSFDETLGWGAMRTRTLTITNTGSAALEFELGEMAGQFTPLLATIASTGINNSGQMVTSQLSTSYPLALGDFTSKASSPVNLTCVTADPSSRYVYAQENGGYGFYRYDPFMNNWTALSSCPIHSGNNGGAAYLDGKIYTAYTGNSSQMGVYDIATDSWTTISNGLGMGTGDITADGQYIYMVDGTTFMRYDPSSDTWSTLASPTISFQPWGGLSYLSGTIYGHQGNGSTGFAKYGIASDTWTTLSSVPGGAVLGSAIDPSGRVYYAYGSYGGNNWYAFDLAGETWSISSIPLFSVNDGGMAYVGQSGVSGIYFVEGESGTGFGRFETAPYLSDVPWLSEYPITGTVAAYSAKPVTITFDASQVNQPGIYQASLQVSSNDPYSPTVSVPTMMTVQPDPNMGKLRGTVTSDRPGGPLEGALVEVISGTTSVVSDTTDAAGGYGPWWLQAGSYTVTVSAGGYLSDTQSVGISAGVTTTHDVTLVRNAPQIAVAPPSYDETLGWGAMQTRTLTITNTGPAALEFKIAERAGGFTPLAGSDVLLVDDDGGGWYDARPYFEAALTSLGVGYDVFDTGGGSGPSAAQMAGYAAVIWFSGDTWDGTAGPNSADETNLATYLDGGGALFLTSQDYYYDMGLTTFMQTYLGVASVSGDVGHTSVTGVPGDPIGDDFGTLALSYPGSNYSDNLMPDGSASAAFSGSAGNYAAIDKEDSYRTVFFGFPWEALQNSSPADGEAVMQAVLDWLAPADVPWLSEAPITGTVPAYSAVPVTITFDAAQVAGLGIYQASLRVSSNDPYSPSVSVPVTMTVPSNTPPTLSGLPDQVFDHSTSPPGTIDLWAYASDAETPASGLTYAIEGTPPAGAGVTLGSNRTVTVNPSPNWCGRTDVTVRATDPGGLWDSDTFRVAVSWSCPGPVAMPGAPVLIAPVDGRTAHSGTPAFAWHPVEGAEGYQVQVAGDAGFSSPEGDEVVASTDYTPAAGLSGGVYTWRVRAVNGSEFGDWSPGWAFAVPTLSPSGFKLYLPVVARKHP